MTLIMAAMSRTEIQTFLNKGTFTGKLATVKEDGSSHVVPIWFVFEYENSKDKFGKVNSAICMTYMHDLAFP